MGGMNSGGHNWRGKPVVEQCLCLKVKDFDDAGALKKGVEGTIDFPSGEHCKFKLTYDDMIELFLPSESTSFQGLGFQFRERHFGGKQAYFVCICNERVSKVYWYRGRFRCRICHGLQYRSQCLSEVDRAIQQAEKAQAKLGMKRPDLEFGVPPKPERMRWATYSKLALIIIHGERERNYDLAIGLQRLKNRKF